jgi:2-polyprenyl-3-methyl-5-hydroxy-6-metoxy-1,4-benzoquinol methylase
MLNIENKNCRFCRHKGFFQVFEYNNPPSLETVFNSIDIDSYYRQIVYCPTCLHMESIHEMNLEGLYLGEYNASTYVNSDGMLKAFNKTINLPKEKSDNFGRCSYINSFISEKYPDTSLNLIKVLDIGSGLGVFPWFMKQLGFNISALDPDPAAVTHIRNEVQVHCYLGDFLKLNIEEKFNIITLNKVLEHVPDPTIMLAKTSSLLIDGGYIYVELPDGECAVKDGMQREEFLIDHFHIFSASSLFLMANRAGFIVEKFDRLKERSTKYTLRAFLKLNT